VSETETSRAIRAAIKRHFPQIRFTRLQAGLITARHGAKIHCADPGWPDIVGYLPDGRFFAIEVKDAGGKTAKHRQEIQQSRAADINACGGVALTASGVFDAIKQIQGVL